MVDFAKLHHTKFRMIVDFETRSRLDVREVGAWRYAEDPSTEILCLSYKLGNKPTKVWTPALPFPQEILDHIEYGGMFEAHNAQFERAVWYFILHLKAGIPMPKRWSDTMAVCAYRGIPMNLDKAGSALNLPIQKDKRGKYLLQVLSQPRKLTKKEIKGFQEQGLTPDEYPVIYRDDYDLMEELYGYCAQDADTEKALSHAIGDLPVPEFRLWVLDQVINQRGVQLDTEAVTGALKITEYLESTLTTELQLLTDKQVETAGQRDKIIEWLRKNGGLVIHNLQKETVDQLLKHKEHLTPRAARVLEIRQMLSRASAKKLTKMIETVCADGRIRGLLQYHGAGTGRWAGRLVQPQNFPRGNADFWKFSNIEELISLIKIANKDVEEAVAALSILYGDPMDAIASSLRGMFVAGQGKKLMVADFSAIEARVVMWVAGCDKAIDAFHLYDQGKGPDIYCVMAQELYKRPINKKDNPEERQLGKITVLGCFGANTPVLTDSGIKAILDVSTEDRVWDGIEWVNHHGVLDQGYKQTIRLAGITVTPNHQILTPQGWLSADRVARSGSTLSRSTELASVSLPSRDLSTCQISDASLSYSNESQSLKHVYDIALAGPRNRFTIMTDQGPLIVHNCGYQMGGDKLQFQAEKDYGVVLDTETAHWLVQTYREAYPEVKQLWYGLQDAAIRTVNSGQPHYYSCIKYEMVHDNAGTWLACVLPNGRKLWYYDPVIEQISTSWGIKDSLTYMGRDNKLGGAWGRIRTYGGMLTENVVQAISRDLMVEGMIRVEKAGYPIILTVHDELVGEPDDGFGSLKEFCALMAGPTPKWATGCPISVEGWEGYRYKK